MIPPRARSTIITCVICAAAFAVFAQSPSPNETDSIRVNVTVNPDGSRTAYQFDSPNHKATAVTTERDGKVRNKIVYRLDAAGRFGSGVTFGPEGKFRFKSIYKYDPAGRILEETQLARNDSVLNKIVYSYDANGKATGYSVLDGAGKVLGRTTSPTPTPTPAPARKKK